MAFYAEKITYLDPWNFKEKNTDFSHLKLMYTIIRNENFISRILNSHKNLHIIPISETFSLSFMARFEEMKHNSSSFDIYKGNMTRKMPQW